MCAPKTSSYCTILIPIIGIIKAPTRVNTPAKMNRAGRITIVLSVLVYQSSALSGYILFGKSTNSDIVSNFDKDLEITFSSILNIIRVRYVLYLILLFFVIHFLLRQTMDCMVFKGSKSLSKRRRKTTHKN